MGQRVCTKVELLSESTDTERILVAMANQDLNRRALIPNAMEWMRVFDLDILTVLDCDGRVLSCGHLPAQYGTRDELSLELSMQNPLTPRIREVRVLRAGKIQNALALVIGTSRKFSAGCILITGGVFLDEDFVFRMTRLTGARIQIIDERGNIIGKKASLSTSAFVQRIDLPTDIFGKFLAYLEVVLPCSALDSAKVYILIMAFIVVCVCIIIAWLMGSVYYEKCILQVRR
jgi:hypothetical protein